MDEALRADLDKSGFLVDETLSNASAVSTAGPNQRETENDGAAIKHDLCD